MRFVIRALVALVVLVATGRRAVVVDAIGQEALWLASGVAAVCMAGSLYLSEVANFPPCKLCWYQRICMYPLVPLLLAAALRRDRLVEIAEPPLVHGDEARVEQAWEAQHAAALGQVRAERVRGGRVVET